MRVDPNCLEVANGGVLCTLRAELSDWRQILTRSRWPIAFSDKEHTTVTDCNEAYCQLHGYTRHEMIGLPVAQMYSPESRQRLAVELQVLQQSGHHTFEAVRLRKDDSTFPALVSLSNCCDEEGRITRTAAFVSDLTDHKRTARDLQEQKELLEKLVATSQRLSAELDLERLAQAVTDGARDICGAQMGVFFYRVSGPDGTSATMYALAGAPPSAFEHLPPPRTTRIFGPTLRDATVIRLDDVTQAPDYGKNTPFDGLPEGHPPVKSYLAVPVMSHSGEPIGALFFGHPEPGRFTRHHEEALVSLAAQTAVAMDNARLFESLEHEKQRAARGEHEYRLLSESIPQLVWTTDADGRTTHYNRRWHEYTGRHAERFDAIHPDEREGARAAWDAALASGGEVPYESEFRLRSSSGDYRWFLARGFPMRDDSQQVLKWFGTCTDIEDQKQAQEFLRRSHEDLEHEVTLRTRELALANEQLKDLDRLKSEFLASISHELRTPLNSILGFTDLILSGIAGEVNPEQSKQLGMVYEAGRHLLSLINDLLDLSRIEAGRAELLLEELDLNQLLVESSHIVSPMMEDKKLLFEVVPAPRILIAISDARKIRQVLLNLLSNAAKFTESGRVRVESGVAGDAYWITVADTGCGIEHDKLPLLFEPFRQLRHSVHEGTGLGLFLCRKLMTLLGGEIDVTSDPNSGSTFTIRLPRCHPSAGQSM